MNKKKLWLYFIGFVVGVFVVLPMLHVACVKGMESASGRKGVELVMQPDAEGSIPLEPGQRFVGFVKNRDSRELFVGIEDTVKHTIIIKAFELDQSPRNGLSVPSR